MTQLTAKQRRAIPASKYGIPPKKGKPGRYPVNDKIRAAKALQFINTGKGVTAADKKRIRRLATEELYGKSATTAAGVKKVQKTKAKKKATNKSKKKPSTAKKRGR